MTEKIDKSIKDIVNSTKEKYLKFQKEIKEKIFKELNSNEKKSIKSIEVNNKIAWIEVSNFFIGYFLKFKKRKLLQNLKDSGIKDLKFKIGS